MIGIIDLEISNVNSVSRALQYLKVEHKVFSFKNLTGLEKSRKLILPGVGSFFEAAGRIRNSGLDCVLKELVQDKKFPILGICLGMQLFASYGEEGGGAKGLDFVKGNVLFHRARQKGLLIPHIGWNDVDGSALKIFDGTGDKPCFYFIHSYEVVLEEAIKVVTCHYGENFVGGFQKENVIGVQFHPEKSQKVGLKLLSNYCEGHF